MNQFFTCVYITKANGGLDKLSLDNHSRLNIFISVTTDKNPSILGTLLYHSITFYYETLYLRVYPKMGLTGQTLCHTHFNNFRQSLWKRTLIRRHFYVMCPLGSVCSNANVNKLHNLKHLPIFKHLIVKNVSTERMISQR